jgi:hypothetical protein
VRVSEPVRDLAKPLLSDPAREKDPLNVLKSTTWSAMLDDVVTDPIRVLKSEICSVRLEASLSEPVSVLKIEECSNRTVEKPMEPERLLVKPFI